MAVELSFCVVNTDRRALLRYCLDAVARERATLAAPTEVLVLDNASGDGSADAAREHGSAPVVIAMRHRRSAGENATTLIERASGRFCLLLDDDPELEPGAAVALHAALDRDAEAGAAAATLVRPDGAPLPSAWRGSRRVLRASGEAPRRADVVQASAVLVRREAVLAAGGFPAAADPHAGEVELARRLAAGGWRVLLVPAARAVQHEGGEPSPRRGVTALRRRVRAALLRR